MVKSDITRILDVKKCYSRENLNSYEIQSVSNVRYVREVKMIGNNFQSKIRNKNQPVFLLTSSQTSEDSWDCI